jgi:hypothetical protein
MCLTEFAITAGSFAASALMVIGIRSTADELGGKRSVLGLA